MDLTSISTSTPLSQDPGSSLFSGIRRFLRPVALTLGGIATGILIGGAAMVCATGTLRAQTIETSAEASVPVLGDNLDQARVRALREAQIASLQHAVETLVAPEWRTLYDRELRRRILPHLDRYLSSVRTTRSEPSSDRTKYIAAVTAQIARVPLAEDLRALPVPVLTDPKRSVRVLYADDDAVLTNAALREDALTLLRPRLDLLNFQISGATALTPLQAALLREPGDSQRRTALLVAQRAEAALFLQIRLGSSGAPLAAARESTVSATLFHGAQGGVLGSFDHRAAPARPTDRLRDYVTQNLVVPLASQMQPAGLQSFTSFASTASQLDLRITGLRSVQEEEEFTGAFFRRSTPFGEFNLARIEPDALVFQGNYAANRASAQRELQGNAFGDFVVRAVNWLDTTLELQVVATGRAKHAELDLFPPDGRPAGTQDMLQAFLSRANTPDITDPLFSEHEDNGWLDRANALAFNAPIYGLIDARADSDFYIGEALAEGEVVEIVWARLDRTNLVPVLRIYDALGQPVKTVVPRFYTRLSYKIPEGQHSFYLEVADRFGYIAGESGGYLKFPYLVTVRRQSPR